MNFLDLGLSERTVKALEEEGISTPTTVQVDVIPSILAGKDVFAIAPSQCGKTYSYVLPLIDIISRHEGQNILIITASSKQSMIVSDSLAVLNKYHEINENTLLNDEDGIDGEANVIIATPNLLIDLMKEGKIDLSQINILVVDDINLIKKLHQLKNLEVVLAALPADKQNIVFTNRRSKETQSILDKILQTPEEIKIDRNKEAEAIHEEMPVNHEHDTKATSSRRENCKKIKRLDDDRDAEAVNLMKRYKTFGRKTPEFLLTSVELSVDD